MENVPTFLLSLHCQKLKGVLNVILCECNATHTFYSTERITYYHHASFSRSRFHEDKIIYDLFKNTTITSSPNEEALLPRGTYVELGAFDGKDGELYQYYIFDNHYFH